MTEPKRVQTSDTGRRSLTDEGKRVVAEAAVAMAKREPTREARLAEIRRRLAATPGACAPSWSPVSALAFVLSELDAEHSERVRLEREVVRLRLACEAALPWVAVAISHREDAHPEAVANHAADLALVREAVREVDSTAAINGGAS